MEHDAADREDVEEARAGDRAAFKRLVQRHDRALLELTTRLRGDRRDGEDARQIAWLKVWRGLPDFDSRASFRTWSWRIAVNACRDLQRGSLRRGGDGSGPRLEPVAGTTVERQLVGFDNAPDRALLERERAALVRVALAQRPDDEREGLVLRHYHDLEQNEIAAIVQRPRTTVQSCLARALMRLHLKLRASFAPELPALRADQEG
ncbi:MAG: sigma-70 family RNA polymerase sigma factor [Planctomycetes bacterium]|nr:sigma-70 family RNA polymerase sigma factor [Planctomycetota bacterium]